MIKIHLLGLDSKLTSPSHRPRTENTEAGQPPISFGGIKNTFGDKMNFIKRRFSSSDLGEQEDGPTSQHGTPQHQQYPSGPPPVRPDSATGPAPQIPAGKQSSTISAPASPTKTYPAFPSSHSAQNGAPPLGQDHSLYSQVSGLTRNLFQAATGQKQPSSSTRDKCKCLLVVDDQHTDWSKYFRQKKILGDWDVRVEQAEFSEISLSSYTDHQLGCMVSIQVNRGGAKVSRQFRPDFVLIRKNVRDANHDWRPVVIGLLYGGVPCINSLHSVYNFLDKPWVFAHLAMIQRKLGRDRFPLIDQAYYPNYKEMQSQQGKFPVVLKIGHAHGGVGKAKASSANEFTDMASIAGMTAGYCTLEPYVDGKYDVHIQKIGQSYKAFIRKSISGNWKHNTGSAMLEQIQMTDRYQMWIDEVAQLFGGLDICAVEAIVAQDGREYIFEVKDCAFQLLGETQEEDRRVIAELVLQRMNHILGVKHAMQQRENMGNAAPQNFIRHESPYSGPATGSQRRSSQQTPGQQALPGAVSAPTSQQVTPSAVAGQPRPQQPPPSGPPPNQAPPPMMPRPPQHGPPGVSPQRQPPQGPPGQPPVRQASGTLPGQQPPPPKGNPPPRPARQPSLTSQNSKDGPVPGQPADDTMGNLRKTFAGIFGDM